MNLLQIIRWFYLNKMLLYINILRGYLHTPFLLIFLLSIQVFSESSETTYSKIIDRKKLIITASEKFDINPAYLSAVIYTERTENYDWTDDVFDEVIARVGKNSSLGFSQVKMKTAYFIEKQLSDSTNEFYCGAKYSAILELSKTPFQIIEKLDVDSLNILYAAAYLKIIQSYWNKKGYSIDNKPDIIGSLYQLGLFQLNGKVREPHFNPKANEFGEKVKKALTLFENFNKNDFNIFIR